MAIRPGRKPTSYFRRISRLKKLFWLYFLLLIFEGALRKWIAPQLSAPLLIIRDPVGIWIIWEAYRTHKWPHRWSAVLSVVTALLFGLFVLQIVAGGNPLIAGLYGLRSYLLPFPLIFIMGENLDKEDLRSLGVFTLWLLPAMTVLEVAQYLSPPISFLNSGAYEGGAQIGFAGAHVRASGTFSFVVGSVGFGVLAASFIFYGMLRESFAPKWLLWTGTFALILSVPMTGSRGFVYQLIGLAACAGLCAMMSISQFGKVIQITLPLLILTFLVSLLPVFSDASQNLISRFEGASQGVEGDPVQTLVFRLVRPVVERVESAGFASSWMGQGIGSGSVAVSVLLQGTIRPTFEVGEDEFAHEVVEMGPLGGIAFALFKLFLAIMIFAPALAMAREQEPLALLFALLTMGGMLLAFLEQPTEQGFMVIVTAFCIAATRVPVHTVKQASRLAIRPQRVLYRSHL
jgi:hypothetical protein